MTQQMRGVFAIPPTPFDETGAVAVEDLRQCLRYCMAAGVHGLVVPVNASEFSLLSDDERRTVMRVAAEEVQGRLPLVMGVSGVSTSVAVEFARYARSLGADAVIAMPPYVHKASEDEVLRYYEAISAAARLPVFVQNYLPPVGTPMSASFLTRLLREIEYVQYVKEETSTWLISELIAKAGNLLRGVMGGRGGRYLLDEYRRGTCGTMPACHVVEVHVRIWRLLEEGKEDQAREIHGRLLPLLNFEERCSVVVYKEVLRRRGIIRNASTRLYGTRRLDNYDEHELHHILGEIEDLLTVRL